MFTSCASLREVMLLNSQTHVCVALAICVSQLVLEVVATQFSHKHVWLSLRTRTPKHFEVCKYSICQTTSQINVSD